MSPTGTNTRCASISGESSRYSPGAIGPGRFRRTSSRSGLGKQSVFDDTAKHAGDQAGRWSLHIIPPRSDPNDTAPCKLAAATGSAISRRSKVVNLGSAGSMLGQTATSQKTERRRDLAGAFSDADVELPFVDVPNYRSPLARSKRKPASSISSPWVRAQAQRASNG